MDNLRCFGYYIIKPAAVPDWCSLKAASLLSVSEDGLSEKFPDLTKCFWVNYPERDRIAYREALGLSAEEFAEFRSLVAELFAANRLSADMRLCEMQDVLRLWRYRRHTEGFRIVGIFTDAEIFAEFAAEGTFDTVPAGSVSGLRRELLGCDILGCESIGNGHFSFTGYLACSLHALLEADPACAYRTDTETGLIRSTYEETKEYCRRLQGKGEFVIWTPFAVYEYFPPEP